MTILSEAAEKACDLIDQYGNDIWFILDMLDIQVIFDDLGNPHTGLKGYCASFFGKFAVIINSRLPAYLQILVAWHELGHIMFDAQLLEKDGFHYDYDFFDSIDTMEQRANFFAAEALIDDEDLMRKAHEGYTFTAMAAEYRIPADFVIYKIQIMRHYGYELNVFDTPDAGCLGGDLIGKENF